MAGFLFLLLCSLAAGVFAAEQRAFVGLDNDHNVVLDTDNDVHIRSRRLLFNGRDAGVAPVANQLVLRNPTTEPVEVVVPEGASMLLLEIAGGGGGMDSDSVDMPAPTAGGNSWCIFGNVTLTAHGGGAADYSNEAAGVSGSGDVHDPFANVLNPLIVPGQGAIGASAG